MKKALVVALFCLSNLVYSTELPRGAEGVYTGTIAAYQFDWQGSTYSADAQEVKVVITDKRVIYTSGSTVYTGDIDFIAQSDNLFIINAKMKTGKSIKIDMQFAYDKKSKSLTVKGSKGVPDAQCGRLKS
jgi:hypothetical protein